MQHHFQGKLAAGSAAAVLLSGLQEKRFSIPYQRPQDPLRRAQRHVAIYAADGGEVGLHLDRCVDLQRPDPAMIATTPTARRGLRRNYLKDLYSTDAQAFRILVMASTTGRKFRCFSGAQHAGQPQQRNFWETPANPSRRIPPRLMTMLFSMCRAVIGENRACLGSTSTIRLAQQTAQGGKRRFCAGRRQRSRRSQARGVLELSPNRSAGSPVRP